MNSKYAEHLELTKEQFIDKMADNMRIFGLSGTLGRVFGIIYMSEEPMTLDQLSEETGMSKTRMSQVIREMLQLNIVEKVFRKGVRKDLYIVKNNYYQTFISLFTSNWRESINKSRLFENRVRKDLKELTKDSSMNKEEEEKLNDLLIELESWSEYNEWLNRLVEFFETGEVFNHVSVPKEETSF